MGIPGRLRRENLKYSVRGEGVDKRILDICRFFGGLFTQAQINLFSPESTWDEKDPGGGKYSVLRRIPIPTARVEIQVVSHGFGFTDWLSSRSN